MNFEIYTALKYLKSKKDNIFISRLLLISILTVTLAITVPVIVLSVVNGFQNSIKNKIIGSNFQYRLRHRNDNFIHFEKVIRDLSQREDVDLAVPFFERQGLIKVKGQKDIVTVTVKAFYNKDITKNKYFLDNFKIVKDGELNNIYLPELTTNYEDDDDEQEDNENNESDLSPNADPDDESDLDEPDDADTENDSQQESSESEQNSIEQAFESINKSQKPPHRDEKAYDLKYLPSREKYEILNESDKRDDKSKSPLPFIIKRTDGVILGDALSLELSTYKGSKIELLIPQGDILLDSNPDNIKTLYVENIYDAGYAKFNKSLIFINFEAIEKIFNFRMIPTDIGINLKKGANTKSFIRFAQKKYPELYLVKTLEEGVFKDFAQEKNLMVILLFFLVLSAFITIYIAVHVVVIDKRREIGILKTIGTKMSHIKLIFVFEGLLISFFGVILGNFLGILITTSITEIVRFLESVCDGLRQTIYQAGQHTFDLNAPARCYIMDPNVFYLNTFPYQIVYSDIILLCAGAIFVSIFAAYFPSKRASEQTVTESLKF